jgi:hypothetical protein
VSGPIKAKGRSTRGARTASNLAGSARRGLAREAAARAASPRPTSGVTRFDLMDFGFNPICRPASRARRGRRRPARDFDVYGAHGTSRRHGCPVLTVPARTYSGRGGTELRQPGSRGSGVRTSWFAPGKGTELEFRHGDGSVSEVVRLA